MIFKNIGIIYIIICMNNSVILSNLLFVLHLVLLEAESQLRMLVSSAYTFVGSF